MERKNIKTKKTDEGKKAAKFKRGGRYICKECGMEVSMYESCECMDTYDLTCCDKEMDVYDFMTNN
ncbi:MAG: hypothetical protein PHX78_02805 [bacterium]|nr:hypothetical protein [bacterium]